MPGLVSKIRRYQRMKNRASRMFKQAGELLNEIIPQLQLKRDKSVKLGKSGAKAVLVDQFAQKLTVFKPCGFDRFKLEIQE